MPGRTAVFTLTRDRLEYTKVCFARMREMDPAGWDHFVWDNGSSDGTAAWLKENRGLFHDIHFHPVNCGIGLAINAIFEHLSGLEEYDVIIKIDNDCYTTQADTIVATAEFVRALGKPCLVGPIVDGLGRGRRNPPTIEKVCGRRFGAIGVGGLFQASTRDVLAHRSSERGPLARGRDGHLNQWAADRGWLRGYLVDLSVEHYETTDGQERRYPAYFDRSIKREYHEIPSDDVIAGAVW